MCGIIGTYNCDYNKFIKSLEKLKNRGIDNFGITNTKDIVYFKDFKEIKNLENNKFSNSELFLGHSLLSINSYLKQPIKKKGILVTNSEIYNYKELNKKYKLNAKNDSELILKLLDNYKNFNNKILEKLDGVYALCYLKDNKIYLSRDILGVKPLFYFKEKKKFGFASEKKALDNLSDNIKILDPRYTLVYDISKNKISFRKKEFLKIQKNNNSLNKNTEIITNKLKQAINKRIPSKKLGLLFSGGIDSLVIAKILKDLDINFKAYFVHIKEIKSKSDFKDIKQIAKEYNIDLEIIEKSINDLEKDIKIVTKTIESTNPIKVGVGLVTYLASKKAKKDKIKVLFSGLGADEVFCGYDRFKKSNDLLTDSINKLYQIHENDIYRDDTLTMKNNIELRLPYLDKQLIESVINIKDSQKIKNNKTKIILREIAKNLKIKEFEKQKKAAQYGSGIDKAIIKLSKQKGYKNKSSYLNSFLKTKNLNLGVLYSSGKDSNLSLFLKKIENYDIKCLISLVPENKDSYMFQEPNTKILKLQQKALEIPIIIKKTKGKKEEELKDLKDAIKLGIKKYNIQGIVSGALFSNYQRNRILDITNKLKIRSYTPLWQKNQKQEMLELLKHGFEFIIVKIAAYGLSEKYLGKIITKKDIQDFEKLEKKYGFNIAGEGGEFETIVTFGPTFKKRLKIIKSEKKLENEFTGYLDIKDIKLIDK